MQQDTSANNKRIAKNTILLYIRSVFLLVITLYTSRIVLKALGVEDYGIYTVVGGVVGLFSMISGTLTSASQRFINFALGIGDKNRIKVIFSNSISIHLLLGIVVVLLLEVFGTWFLFNKLNLPDGRFTEAYIVFQCSLLVFLINMICIPFNALIIAHERMSAFAYISILDGLLKFLAALSVLSLFYNQLLFFASLQVFISCMLLLIYYFYCKKRFEETKKIKLGIDHEIFKSMFSFAGWNLLGQGSLVLRNQGADILLNLFFGVYINAAKGISNQVQQGIAQFSSNFSTAIKPQLIVSIAQKNYTRAYELILQGTKYSFFLLLLFVIPVMISCEDILSFWLGEVPNYSVTFVKWTLIYLLSHNLSFFLIQAILANGNIKSFQLVTGGTKLSVIPIVYIILLNGGSPVTAIIVNILIEVICIFQSLYFCQKYLEFPIWDYIKIILYKCLPVLLISYLCARLLPYYFNFNFIILVFVSIVICIFNILLWGLTNKERLSIKKVIKNKQIFRQICL